MASDTVKTRNQSINQSFYTYKKDFTGWDLLMSMFDWVLCNNRIHTVHMGGKLDCSVDKRWNLQKQDLLSRMAQWRSIFSYTMDASAVWSFICWSNTLTLVCDFIYIEFKNTCTGLYSLGGSEASSAGRMSALFVNIGHGVVVIFIKSKLQPRIHIISKEGAGEKGGVKGEVTKGGGRYGVELKWKFLTMSCLHSRYT